MKSFFFPINNVFFTVLSFNICFYPKWVTVGRVSWSFEPKKLSGWEGEQMRALTWPGVGHLCRMDTRMPQQRFKDDEKQSKKQKQFTHHDDTNKNSFLCDFSLEISSQRVRPVSVLDLYTLHHWPCHLLHLHHWPPPTFCIFRACKFTEDKWMDQ